MTTNLTALLIVLVTTNWFHDLNSGKQIALRAETKLLVVEYAGRKFTNEVDKYYTGLVEVKDAAMWITNNSPINPTNFYLNLVHPSSPNN